MSLPHDMEQCDYCDELISKVSRETDKMLAGLRNIVHMVDKFGESATNGSRKRLRSQAVAGQGSNSTP